MFGTCGILDLGWSLFKTINLKAGSSHQTGYGNARGLDTKYKFRVSIILSICIVPKQASYLPKLGVFIHRWGQRFHRVLRRMDLLQPLHNLRLVFWFILLCIKVYFFFILVIRKTCGRFLKWFHERKLFGTIYSDFIARKNLECFILYFSFVFFFYFFLV